APTKARNEILKHAYRLRSRAKHSQMKEQNGVLAMKYRNLLVGCLALVLAGGAVAVSQFRMPAPDNPDLHDMLSQPKTEMRMHLYGAHRNEANGQSMNGKTLGFDHYR